ncbi:MAG: hypothetical protein COA79_04675 [Planctomycetota bacterium]|nr:MAG: hypothetical protein COA79_04675 [Planctomycetota bacterium]
MTYKKILVSIEHLTNDGTVLKAALDIANLFKAKVTVLHVNSPMAGVPSRVMREMEHKVTPEELDDYVDKNNLKHLDVTLEVLKSKNMSNTILEKSIEYDLIVLGHRHLNFFEELLGDSLDEQIINDLQCHCLVVPKS